MKTSIKTKVASLLSVFILVASMVSCSDDDDKNTSFLENHADTVWKFVQPVGGGSIYVQINDNEMSPFEIWVSLIADACFIHEKIEDDGTPEVLENTANRVVIRIDETEGNYYTIITMSVSGDTLTVISEYYEDDELDEEEIFVMDRTDENPHDLELCSF